MQAMKMNLFAQMMRYTLYYCLPGCYHVSIMNDLFLKVTTYVSLTAT